MEVTGYYSKNYCRYSGHMVGPEYYLANYKNSAQEGCNMKNTLKVLTCAMCFAAVVAFSMGSAFAQGRVQVIKSTEPRGGHEGHIVAFDKIVIKRAKGPDYVMKYYRCTDPSHKQNGTPVGNGDTGLGLMTPTIFGWYHNKSFGVYVNGKDITQQVVADYYIADLSDRTLVAFVWDNAEITVKTTFAVLDGRDDLLVDCVYTPKTKIGSIGMLISGVPSAYTASQKVNADRWVVTSSGKEDDVKCFVDGGTWKSDPEKKLSIAVPGESWIFYADKILDPANNQGGGPSGIFFLPENLIASQITVTGYFVYTSLNVNPAGGRVRMAMQNFPGWTNSKALKYMSEGWPAIKEVLASGDFEINKAMSQEITGMLNKVRGLLADCEKSKLSPADAAKLAGYKKDLADAAGVVARTDASLAELGSARDKSQMLIKNVTAFGLSTLTN
jgi:hypothetical protein